MNKRRCSFGYSAIIAMLFFVLICFTVGADASAPDPRLGLTGKDALCPSETGELVSIKDIPYARSFERKGLISMEESEGVSYKSLPLVVIVAGFNNMHYDNAYDWNNEFFSLDKSVRAYYMDQSYKQFGFDPAVESSKNGSEGNTNTPDRENDGVIHVKLDIDHEDWGAGRITNAQSRDNMLVMAMNKAGKYIDYKSYDTNNNGMVETSELQVAIIVAGYANEAGASQNPNLNYHACAGKPDTATVSFEYEIDRCATMAEYINSSGGNRINKYSTMCHELGHNLGIRDMYDTARSNTNPWYGYDPRFMSLMSMGNHGVDISGNPCPTSFDPWSKIKLGWVKATTVQNPGTYTVNAIDYNNPNTEKAIYKIPIRGKEYYLVENRQFVKWDEGLSRSHESDGLAFWHIDDTFDGQQPNKSTHRPGNCPLYPERDSYGSYNTFMGKVPNTRMPCLDLKIWNSEFRSTMGSFLVFPTFADQSVTDGPETREYSKMRVEIMSNSGSAMQFRIPGEDEHGHLAGNIKRENEVPATCESEGSYLEIAYCVLCGEEMSRTVKTVKKLAHQKINVARVAPTCEKNGTRKHYECTGCGKWYDRKDITKEVTRESQILPATGHKNGETVTENTVAATCEGDGTHDEVVYCNVCNKEISRITKTDAQALGHSWDEGKITKAATCAEEGVKTYTCTNNSSHTQPEKIPKLTTHTGRPAVEENRIEPSCDEAGSYDEVVYCGVCNTEMSRDEKTIEAKGHSWDEGKITKAATCAEEGVKTYTCTNNSSHTQPEKIPKLTTHTGRPAVEENRIEPSCDEAGSYDEVVYCGVCNTEMSRDEKTIEAKRHDWGEWESIGSEGHQRKCRIDANHTETAKHDWERVNGDAHIPPHDACKVCGQTGYMPTCWPPWPVPDYKGVESGNDIESAEQYIISSDTEKDFPRSSFAPLKLKSSKQSKNSIKLEWKRNKDAEKYIIYGSLCGRNNKLKKVAVVKSAKSSYNVKKIDGTKLKKGKYYKFIIVAVRHDRILISSKIVHVATSGGKVGNHKTINIKVKVGKKYKVMKRILLKKGKTSRIKPELVKDLKKVKKQTKVRYESSNPNIAYVDKSGLIEAKQKGKCSIYIYAPNGISKKVTVVVR